MLHKGPLHCRALVVPLQLFNGCLRFCSRVPDTARSPRHAAFAYCRCWRNRRRCCLYILLCCQLFCKVLKHPIMGFICTVCFGSAAPLNTDGCTALLGLRLANYLERSFGRFWSFFSRCQTFLGESKTQASNGGPLEGLGRGKGACKAVRVLKTLARGKKDAILG